MSNFERKVLWALDVSSPTSEARVLDHAEAAGCGVVCVRSPSKRLSELIASAHARHLQVYAWRWPAVRPQRHSTTHYFVEDEAAFVRDELIPAGLDGYIVDPESDKAGAANDWNDEARVPLAKQFCKTIREAARDNPGFRFGTTSGCTYPKPNNRPHIPWRAFNEASDVLLPQSYWRVDTSKGPKPANGGTPKEAVRRGIEAWSAIPHHKPVVPIAGELAMVTPAEIADYGAALVAAGIREAHIYIDGAGATKTKLAAFKAL